MNTMTPVDPEGEKGTDKKIARIVGILFIAAFLTYGPGNGVIESLINNPGYLPDIFANKIQVVIGAILMLMNSVIVIGIGILLFPILQKYSPRIAHTYFATRIVESILLTVGVIFLLLLLPISQAYINAGDSDISHLYALGMVFIKGNYFAFQIAMAALSFGSLFFCYLLYVSALVPRFIAVWGFIGYVLLLVGSLLELFGFDITMILSIPGGLFEISLGLYLIVKGFSSATVVPIVTKNI